jgi:hypothetical protein
MDNDQKFWVRIWLIIFPCITIILTTAIAGGYMYSGLQQKLQTIQRENLTKNCKQVDTHQNQYGGTTSYSCNDKERKQ